jgi:mono/diheme cytochrome c family protein
MKSAATFISLLFMLTAVGVYTAQEAAPPATSGGLFTKAQAERGKVLYNAKCGSCHGMELVADEPEAGDLTGMTYRSNWHGKTVADRFEITKTTMPPGSPMTLTDQEYLDIVVHILHFNGYPIGDKELTPDPKRLEQIVVGPQ